MKEEPFDIEKYRVSAPQKVEEPQQAQMPEKESMPTENMSDDLEEPPINTDEQGKESFGEFDLEKHRVEPMGYLHQEARKGANFGLGALEQIIGSPGQFNNLIMDGIVKASEGIYGGELEGLRNYSKKFKATSKTPEYWQELESKLTNGTFDPKNDSEKMFREMGADTGALIVPIPGMRGMNAVQAIGTALVGQGVKQVVKQFTNNDIAPDAAKVGAFFAIDLLTRNFSGNNAMRYIDELYQGERSLVPQGARTSAAHLERETNAVLNDLRQSNVRTPSSSTVERAAEQILSDIQHGEADVNAMLLQKRRLNELRGDPSLHRNEQGTINRLSNAVETNLEHYGGSLQADPHFLATHKAANEAYATMQQSRFISNAVRKYIPKSASHLLLTLFGEAVTGHAAAIGPTLTGVAAITSSVKTGELLYRVMASPTLRNYYLGVLREASLNNVGALSNELSKLNQAMKKEGLEEEFGEE